MQTVRHPRPPTLTTRSLPAAPYMSLPCPGTPGSALQHHSGQRQELEQSCQASVQAVQQATLCSGRPSSPRSAPAPPHTRAPASHLRQAQLGRVHDGLVHSERSDQDLRGGGRQARWVWTQTCQRWQAGKAPTDGATTHPCPRSSSRGTHCPSRRLASRRRYAQRTACSCGHSRVCPRSSARSWPAAQPACLQQNGRAGGGLSSSWQVQQNLLPATAQPVACIAGGGLPSMHPPSSVVLPQPEGPMMACGAGLGAINNYATVMVNNAARIPAV